MKISRVRIYDVDYGTRFQGKWNPVIVQITTSSGLTGIGETALAYGCGAKAACQVLQEFAREYLLGQDAGNIEGIWQTLFRKTFWGQSGGPIIYGAMSAIDEALWDIKGRRLGVPVYELLGGGVNRRLRLYANGWYDMGLKSPQEYAEGALRVVADGFTALKFDPFLITPDGRFEHPPRHIDRAWARLGIERVRAVREAVGPAVDILVEIHGNLGTADAILIGKELEQFHPYCYEEPVGPENVDSMKKVSDNVNIPIAAGERLYTRYGFREYIEKQALDILQPDIGLAGGFTEVRKIATHAETYNLHVQPHNFGGPVGAAVAAQFDAATTNFIIQEWYPYDKTGHDAIVRESYQKYYKNGWLDVPALPGLGLELNEDYLKQFTCIEVKSSLGLARTA